MYANWVHITYFYINPFLGARIVSDEVGVIVTLWYRLGVFELPPHLLNWLPPRFHLNINPHIQAQFILHSKPPTLEPRTAEGLEKW